MNYHCAGQIVIQMKSLKMKFVGCRPTFTQFTAFKCSKLGNVLKKNKNIVIYDTESKQYVTNSNETLNIMVPENGIGINNIEYKIQYLKLSEVPENVFNI